MSAWILDGVVWHSHLLPFSLNKSSVEHTGVMIVVDMTQPWNIMESLERWIELLRKHIDSLGLPNKVSKEMRERCKEQCVWVRRGGKRGESVHVCLCVDMYVRE